MDTITLTRPTAQNEDTDDDPSSTAACPDCGAATVSAQGLLACGRCRWHAATGR